MYILFVRKSKYVQGKWKNEKWELVDFFPNEETAYDKYIEIWKERRDKLLTYNILQAKSVKNNL